MAPKSRGSTETIVLTFHTSYRAVFRGVIDPLHRQAISDLEAISLDLTATTVADHRRDQFSLDFCSIDEMGLPVPGTGQNCNGTHGSVKPRHRLELYAFPK